MKYDPKENMGSPEKQDDSEGKPAEYDKDGKACKGGGYMKKAGKLYKIEKSLTPINSDDLEKSIGQLEALANEDTMNRKDTLLAKAQTDDLSKAEHDELFQILGGGSVEPKSEISDTIVKSFQESEPLQKAIDVSDYLRENHEALEKSLVAIGEEIQKSDNRRHLVKSMAEQMDMVLDQPARGPKSLGAAPMQKSFGGTPPEGEQLNKSQVLDTLEEISKSNDSVNGENVSIALSKYESSNMISRNMLAAVNEFRTTQAAH